MIFKRRKFIEITTLGMAALASGLPLRVKAAPSISSLKSLKINMPTPNGRYTFVVDGQRQLVRILNQQGTMWVPEDSCFIEYYAPDGLSRISVFIDQGTEQANLLPGTLSGDTEIDWHAELLGNPITDGKIIALITGPINAKPSVEITDLNGRTLMKGELAKQQIVDEFIFDVQNQPVGMLLFTVRHDRFSKTLKVLHSK